MRIILTVFFFLLFGFIIHMVVFVLTSKTVADNLGIIGVLAHSYGSYYLARVAVKKINASKNSKSSQPAIQIGDTIDRCKELYGEPINNPKEDDHLLFLASPHPATVSVTFSDDSTVGSVMYAVPPGEFISRENALNLLELSTKHPIEQWEIGTDLFGNEKLTHANGMYCLIDENSVSVST